MRKTTYSMDSFHGLELYMCLESFEHYIIWNIWYSPQGSLVLYSSVCTENVCEPIFHLDFL
jgi:hypothetical protein